MFICDKVITVAKIKWIFQMTVFCFLVVMFSLNLEDRLFIYQHVFEERTFKEMSILNQMTEERCKGAYYWAIRKIRKRMGGKKS